MTLDSVLSQRTLNLQASPIREILALIDRPGMISFAGGLPANETFPVLQINAVPASVLQYGATEGDTALREKVAGELRPLGLNCTAEQVIILSGSQQGIDLVGKLLIDAGTPVAVESPTYLAALQVFRYYGARLVEFDPNYPALKHFDTEQPRLAYVIPTFQNPTGQCYSAAQRDSLADACDATGVILFEDDPYRDLVYDPCNRTPICSKLKRAHWIYQGSFSKSLAPGLRLGFMVSSPTLTPYLTRLKQAADLHSNRVSQWFVLSQMNHPERGKQLALLAETYKRKRDAFADSLARHFGDLATWSVPPGGLFFWLRLKCSIDTRKLLPKAIERGVAFMPGESFYANPDEGLGTLRLNFSHASESEYERGLNALAELLAQTSGQFGEPVNFHGTF